MTPASRSQSRPKTESVEAPAESGRQPGVELGVGLDCEVGAEPGVGKGLPRWLEILVAGFSLLVSSPILAVAAVAIRLDSPGPALFRQRRIGRGGVPFELLKLRTMRRPVEPQGVGDSLAGDTTAPEITATGDPRVTPIGRLLRRTKLDELPELWNVLRGEMALVGPRPEVPRFVDLDDSLWRQALAVRPGLTDPATLMLRDEESVLAQLAGQAVETGRNELYRSLLLPFKLSRSTDYVRTRSARSDIGVLIRTLLAVVAPRRDQTSIVDQILAERAGRAQAGGSTNPRVAPPTSPGRGC